tara:strand:+ start:11948 stop:12391 length:444 start_codon:yes stop_codon:yes gene_type:complete
MRIFLFSLTFFVSITCFCQEKKLIEIRSCFKTIQGINEVEKLINISENNLDNPVILAYYYTGKLMMLDYSNNPFEKYNVFKTKTKQMDSIVSANPKNIEIRLLRYALQKNSPYFLKYSSDLRSDLNYIKSNLFKEKEYLQVYIENLL